MVKVCVAGATGYTGLELIRLLLRHPKFEIECVTADSNRGKRLSEVCPSLTGIFDPELKALDEEAVKSCELLFLALPHGASMSQVPAFLNAGCRIVDLSADFRLHQAKVFEDWYQTPHVSPECLEQAVYGLPELHREQIASANLVANPGCYPTSVILAMAPLMQCDWIDRETIIADCKSGVSGAGRKLSATTQFCESNEGVSAYGLTTHRHTPEIEQELSAIAGNETRIVFSPHLMPMTRGILATVYLNLRQAMKTETALDHFKTFYEQEPFVRVLPPGRYANTHQVAGSNFCDIGIAVDQRTQRLIVTSAIDNLMKGASSQAIQNANVMFDFPETMGLESAPVFP